MQEDFHYYATYCAAYLAGYDHEESLDICYSAQFVDLCSRTLLGKLKAPRSAATTQLQLELMDVNTDPIGLQDITRIWSSFHFLPGDLYAEKKAEVNGTKKRKRLPKRYRNKYRLICNTNGELVRDTVELAKGSSLQAVGIAMHVLADTWAHRYFAGTPSLVINNTNYYFYELLPKGNSKGFERRPVIFRHSVSAEDDLDNSIYTSSLYQFDENSIMNLGHGRAGHLPDYSFIRYCYLPAWGDYEEIIKDNPSDYIHAFSQMVYAMRFIRGERPVFDLDTYETGVVIPWKDEIKRIIEARRLDASEDWKTLGEKMSGREIEAFDIEKYQQEYLDAPEDLKDDTFLGRFFIAAMAHKSMVNDRIFRSGNLLAGISIDFDEKGFKGMKDFKKLVENAESEAKE